MSLLTALNDAQRLLSLPVTTGIVGDGQETQNLLFALAKEEVSDCAQRHDWPTLRRTQSFTATTGQTLQTAPGKPADFDRAVRDTLWNRTTDRKLGGPLNDQEWAIANGVPVTTAITQYFMFRYDGLHIWPAPTAADTIAFDYIINTAWENSGGTALTTPTADSDVSKLGDRLLKLGVVWRYKQAKGRDYAEDQKNYEVALERAVGVARSSRALSIAPPDIDPLLDVINVPDTGFGA